MSDFPAALKNKFDLQPEEKILWWHHLPAMTIKPNKMGNGFFYTISVYAIIFATAAMVISTREPTYLLFLLGTIVVYPLMVTEEKTLPAQDYVFTNKRLLWSGEDLLRIPIEKMGAGQIFPYGKRGSRKAMSL